MLLDHLRTKAPVRLYVCPRHWLLQRGEDLR